MRGYATTAFLGSSLLCRCPVPVLRIRPSWIPVVIRPFARPMARLSTWIDDWRRGNDMEPTPYFWVGCTSFRMRSLPAASPRLGPVEEGERFPMSAADAEIVLRALRSVDLPISPREGFGDTGRAWGALTRGALPSSAG
jgi:hypothetical protein